MCKRKYRDKFPLKIQIEQDYHSIERLQRVINIKGIKKGGKFENFSKLRSKN